MKRDRKQWLCFLLLICNVAFIWCNSMLPREISSAFSRWVGSILRAILGGSEDIVEGSGQGLLRKIAHFAEFFTLGMLLHWLSRLYSWKTWQRYVLPMLMGTAVAAIDETIQIFVPGRGPGLRDVGIDSLGVLLGVLIFSLICAIPRRKNRKQTKE